jgi:hypothetical protein
VAGESNEGSWVDILPEPIREWDEVKNAGDEPEKFWDQMGNMRSRLGQSIRIPSEEAGADDRQEFYEKLMQVSGVTRIPEEGDAEGWASFYNSVGRPAKPEEYTFDASNEEKAFYHGLGLSDAQAARIVEATQQRSADEKSTRAAEIKSDYNNLMAEWGDGATRKLAGIKHVLNKFDDSGALGKALEDPNFQYAPELLRALGNLGDIFLEKAPPGAAPGQHWGITPQEARERANEMLHNPDSPRNNPSHPNHRSAQEEYMRLRRIATGEIRA